MSQFPTTRWSLIIATRTDDARAALDALCRSYRAPVLSYLRAHGHAREDAEDLAQSFFVKLLGGGVFAGADPARGRFRAYLLAALKNFAANRAVVTQKRGNGIVHERFDAPEPSEQVIAQTLSPEHAYDLSWARTVMQRALRALEAEALASDRAQWFSAFAPFLSENPDPGEYAALAAQFGIRRNTLAVSIHRLRQRFRELIRKQLLETVADPGDVEHELQDLRAVLGGKRTLNPRGHAPR